MFSKMSICPMNLINRTLVCVRQAISFHSIVLDPSWSGIPVYYIQKWHVLLIWVVWKLGTGI